jgi:Ca2+-binding EF-hand superfamily protein
MTMITEFQKSKFDALFKQLDADQSGTLEYTDFTAHAVDIKQRKGWSDDNPTFLSLLDAKRNFWTELRSRVTTAYEDRVTLGEWRAFFTQVVTEVTTSGKVPEWLMRFHFVLLSALDIDRDGSISLEEYSLHLKSVRSEADPRIAFTLLDTSGNGQIDLRELETIFSQWLLSNNPSDPGNIFFTGQLP